MNPANSTIKNKLYLFVGIMLVASVLRAPITGVGPLLDIISKDLNLSTSACGLLTSMPVFIFAAVSPLTRYSARYLGIERSLLLALIFIFTGLCVRSLGMPYSLFLGTIVLSIGIAAGNVFLPSIIKRDFPQKTTMLTTSYITIMSGLGAVASGVAVPVAVLAGGTLAYLGIGGFDSEQSASWAASLGIWAVMALLAIILWLPQTKDKKNNPINTTQNKKTVSILKSGLAWQVTIFMGLQAMGFYSMVAWLAAILHGQGLSESASGWLVAYYQMIGLVSGLALPFLVSRCKDQRFITCFCGSLCAIGAFGLFLLPEYAALWLTISGFGGGGSFILAIAFISLRSNDFNEATALSSMLNGIGYLIAALGPLIFGMLHDFTGSWGVVLVVLGITGTTQSFLGWKAGRDEKISNY